MAIKGCAPLFDCGRAYWGYANKSMVPSKLFADVEYKITKKVLKHVDPHCLEDLKNMRQLINEYAEISDEVKDNITKMLFGSRKIIRNDVVKNNIKNKEVDSLEI